MLDVFEVNNNINNSKGVGKTDSKAEGSLLTLHSLGQMPYMKLTMEVVPWGWTVENNPKKFYWTNVKQG